MTEVTFIVPAIPPSVNHYSGQRKNGGRYRTKKAIDFDWLVIAEWNKRGHPQIVASAYAVDMVFQWKSHEPDLDNLLKVGQDALQHCGAITNDRLITDLSLHKQRGDFEQTIYTIRALTSSEDHPLPTAEKWQEPAF